MQKPPLTLYIGKGCRFCEKVLDYLEQNPAAFPIEIIDVWSDETKQEELRTLTGRTQVPCLKIGQDYLHESLEIIQKLKNI